MTITAMLFAAFAAAAQPASYQNPLIPGNLADPAVIRHEGMYYLYATGEVKDRKGTRVFTSSNLVDWTRGPVVFEPGLSEVWAPDVWRDPDSGKFYLYYTADMTVGVAEADGPLGPFIVRRKFFDQALDAHLFRDDDGKLYLYYVTFPGFRIMVRPLASPTELAGESVEILRPESPWETRNGHVTEGPWIIKRDKLYHMLYSGSGADTPDYAVGYATADSPLGPFTRAPHNPILSRADGLFGPGHGCAIQDADDKWWFIYHQKENDGRNYERFIAMDPLWFDRHGALRGRATRGTPNPVPAAAPTAASAPPAKPNIIFILADDLGWSDTTLYGTTKFYQTPNIERLARRGMTFTRAYSASPLCSPTRAAILTGLSPARTGITTPNCHLPQVVLEATPGRTAPPGEMAVQPRAVSRLKTDYRTLAVSLKEAGYATGHFGKWHLGPRPYSPLEHGFEVDIPRHPGPGPAGSFVAPWKFQHIKANFPGEHIEDRMAGEAVAWMEKHKDRPFFLNYWQFSVHAPFDAKPNILVIFTDDQGFTDLGIHGVDPDVRTPNLDQLARDGALFTRGYTTAPQCVPSRAGLLTGRHQNAFGLDDNGSGPLSHAETTLAERLAKIGYTTGMVGKWHLDIGRGTDKGSPDFLPHRHGFQEYFCGPLHNYHASHDLAGNALDDPPQRVRDTRYRIDVQTEAALSFLDRRTADEKPFFLYLAYFAPHAPVEAPPSYLERMSHVRDPQRRKGLASILAIDDGIGKLRAKLTAMGAADNTLIFYISDNGAPLRSAAYVGSHNQPMIGEKGMLTDGGQRVPFIATWPGRIPKATTFDHPVWTLDATATALAAAGAPCDDKIEGANLLPWLNDAKQGPVHEALYWRWRSQAAILSGNWKLVLLGDRQRYLFDLTESGKETAAHNRIAQHPEIAAELERKLIAMADTWKTKGLPQDIVRPDQLFFDMHIDDKSPPRGAKRRAPVAAGEPPPATPPPTSSDDPAQP